MILERLGRLPEAEASYRSGMAICPQNLRNRSSLGHLLARTGRKSEVKSILNNLLDDQEAGNDVCFQLVRVYVGLGEIDTALGGWSADDGQTTMPFLSLEKRFESRSAHPATGALRRA